MTPVWGLAACFGFSGSGGQFNPLSLLFLVWFLEKTFIMFKFRFNFDFDVIGERGRWSRILPQSPMDLQLLSFKTWLSPC